MNRRRAFTLLELLVVIAIIMVLGGILLVSLSAFSKSQKSKTTRTTFNICKNWVKEASTSKEIALPLSNGAILAGRVDTDGSDRTGKAVKDTALVMKQLRRMNVNAKSMDQMSSQQFMTVDNVKVPLDGWNNPIIYVPPGGLSTKMKDGTSNTVTYKGEGFFASAGADGDFGTHDDNLYSFEE
mgnify:CR=1 FL=1